MTEQSGIAPLTLPRDAVTQLRDVLDQLLRTCTCDHEPARHGVDGSCQSCNCPAAGYCPHCGSGDAGPTPEAYETARQRAVRFQARTDNARDWARHNLDGQQQAGLLGVLRGDGEAGSLLDAVLRQILADANHHDLCATESQTPEGGISHSSIAAGLRIAARHILAAQQQEEP
ncbi:hypothetical protein [Streptomyces yangpuensis]|uniref:hypothetical protein n=1 Tax=Streptomyces yangpuensis TaxID=1648182 RepID=UPI0035DE5353